ncbi:hypothetical protein Scep_010504 [Stephania cephalantha]|uniref:Pentatricopeptide repeat-containing protein n=1 Tax=Stephania cephalantha TaxID=152367 RepID=A0AAP0JWG5_9MAGN
MYKVNEHGVDVGREEKLSELPWHMETPSRYLQAACTYHNLCRTIFHPTNQKDRNTEIVTSPIRDLNGLQRSPSISFLLYEKRSSHGLFYIRLSHKLLSSNSNNNNDTNLLHSCDLVSTIFAFMKKFNIRKIPYRMATLITNSWFKKSALEIFPAFSKSCDFVCQPIKFILHLFTYIFVIPLSLSSLALHLENQSIRSQFNGNRYNYFIPVDSASKAGAVELVWELLEEMKKSGILIVPQTFNVLISAYAKMGAAEKAVDSFGQMKDFNSRPNTFTYNTMLHLLVQKQVMDEIVSILKCIKNEGFVVGLNGYSCLIDGLFRIGRFREACRLWHNLMSDGSIAPDCILYTIMMKGLTMEGKVEDAVKLLSEMASRGIVPDTFCYNTLIKGFCDMGLLDEARSLKLEISQNDCFPDSATYTILICGLCKKGLVDEAQQIFEEMEKLGCLPTVMTFNALISGLCKAGELEQAHFLFYKMEIGRNPSLFLRLSQGAERVLDSASLQILVEHLCESGLILKAYKLLIQLADSGVVPNIFTYNILINGLCKARDIDRAFKIFKELQLKGHSPDSVTYATLIDGLQRVNREEDAVKLFDQMVKNGCTPTVVIYKTLLTALCRRGKVAQTFSLWLEYVRSFPDQDDMAIKLVEENFERGNVEEAIRGLLRIDFKCKLLDPSPYNIWLIGFCRAGKVGEALKLFSILEKYKVDISPPSCVMLIYGLCQCGMVDIAVDIFLYTLEKDYKLLPPVCNRLITSLFYQDRKGSLLDLVTKMGAAGYDLKLYLNQTTKSMLRDLTLQALGGGFIVLSMFKIAELNNQSEV